MNKFADFLNRVHFYIRKGHSSQEAKEKSIAEMLAFGLIKNREEIEVDKEKYQKEKDLFV